MTASLVLPTGCRKPEIQVYDVPKSQSDTTQEIPAGLATSAESFKVAWTPSPQWQQLPATQFRKGNYAFEDEAGTVEITVTSFPGTTGGLLANANRWLRQASLPEITEEALQDRAVEIEIEDGASATVLDLRDDSLEPNSARIYAAVVPYDGESWFFKMSGPFAAVQGQIPAFSALIRGLRFGESAALSSVAPTTQNPHVGDLAFTPPAGWNPSKGSSMRIASFSVEMEGHPAADFAVTAFPGDTGGEVANVNRWRAQINLGDWTAEQVQAAAQTLKNPAGHEFRVFELKPQADGEWIRVAIMQHAGKSWFFKLRGDAVVVDLQKDEFNSVLETVHFSHAGHNH